jgi:hypothetical protein
MNSTVVNISLSFIKQELRSTIASAQWVFSGYLLVLALMLPLNAWLVACARSSNASDKYEAVTVAVASSTRIVHFAQPAPTRS